MTQLIPNGTYPITNVFSGFDLKPLDNSVGSGIVTRQNDNTDAFKWTFFCTNANNNTYTITNKAYPALAAYVADNSGPDINVTVDSSAQIFTISNVAGVPNTYNIFLNSTLSYWSVYDNIVTLQAANLSYDNQWFTITGSSGGPLTNGRYKLKNQAANLKVLPQEFGTNSKIEPGVDDGSNDFRWQLATTGANLFTIQNMTSGLFVWMDPSRPTGSPAVVSTTTQSFAIVEVAGKTGIYTIQTPNQKYLGIGGNPSVVVNGDSGTTDAFQWAIAH